MLEEAARNGAALPLSTAHLQLLERAEALGIGDLDNSAIIRVIQSKQRSE
jgi:3-hydroxyisobutyrate dehydrogenase-like beta-hydroxyacid dehydrogenase